MRHRGFTIIEVLTVIAILLTLAALIGVSLYRAYQVHQGQILERDLSTIRSRIDIYKSEHGGTPPRLALFWEQMTQQTDIDGSIQDDGALGPYLQKIYTNPFTNSSSVVASNSFQAWRVYARENKAGWAYEETTGTLWAVGFDDHSREYKEPPSSQPEE